VLRRQVRVREERRHSTGREAAELDERLCDVRRGCGATRAGHLHANERAQQAVGRRGPNVGLKTAARQELQGIVGPGERLDVAGVDTDAATDADAGIRATRDVEEAGAVRGADADVVDSSSNRRSPPHGKIRRLSPGHSSETRRRSEEKALSELHL